MSTEIIEYGTTASGATIAKGRYAVDPNGHVVLVPTLRPIKPGWRLATQADIDACKPGADLDALDIKVRSYANEIVEGPRVIDVSDEPIEADVESISIDAPISDERD